MPPNRLLQKLSEWRDRRRVRRAFSAFLPPDLVEQIVSAPEQFRPAGEERDLTVLVCSLRGFVRRSARFKGDVQNLARFVNAFHAVMVPEILERGGTVDKFMGDKIVAFWNAPDWDAQHVSHALAAGLAMRRAVARLNAELPAQFPGIDGLFPLQIGLGIDTGLCAVGNMGAAQRFEYSAIGYPVAHAGHLERWCKFYGTELLLSADMQRRAPDTAMLEFDLVAPAANVSAAGVYGVLGDVRLRDSDSFRTLSDAHAAFLKVYRNGYWQSACELLARCRQLARPEWRLDSLYDCYEKRIAKFQAAPPPPDWAGAHVAPKYRRRPSVSARFSP